METSEQRELIKILCGKTGIDQDKAKNILDNFDWDLDAAIDYVRSKKKKEPKIIKIFKVGDWVKCINPKPTKKMTENPDCIEYLTVYKKFKVLEVTEKHNIDIGHRLEKNGNPYYYSPNRFELLNGTAPTITVEPTKEEEGKEGSGKEGGSPFKNKTLMDIGPKKKMMANKSSFYDSGWD